MAPAPERKTKIQELRLVQLNLCDNKPFNVQAFDEAVFWMNEQDSQAEANHSIAQFIIVDDVMYVFPPTDINTTVLDLAIFNDWHPEVRLQGIQAYGAIELEDTDPVGKGHMSRMIVPCTMIAAGSDSREASSRYMQGRFKELIGDSRDRYTFTIAY